MNLIRKKSVKAFTLIEVLFAVVIVAIAVVALVGSNVSYSKANGFGSDLATAEFLVQQVRELTRLLPVVDPQDEISVFGPESGETIASYDDLDDFDNASFNPPINTQRTNLANFPNFTQQVIVENVNSSDFSVTVNNHSSDFVRVTVTIYQSGKQILSESWIRARL